MNIIKIALLDDQNIIMDGISALLMNQSNIEVVGHAKDKEGLFQIIEQFDVNIVFLDVFLPQPIGIEILKSIVKDFKNVKVMMLSGNDEEDLISNAFQSGASAYLSKSIDKEELIDAINLVNDGEQYISRSLEKKLTKNFIYYSQNGDKYSRHKLSGLTQRELEMIKLISDGLSYKEIANAIDVSIRTVESHKNNILAKLELKNTIELVKFAIKNKLIEI
jgi:DNA-binding NarL/FixJ family response regulator